MNVPHRTRAGLPSGHVVLGERASIVLRRRSLLVSLAALALGALCAVAGLLTGAYHLGPAEVLEVLLGGGSRTARFILLDQRLPRALAGLAVGGMLGVSGAVFQSVAHNPLGSPDVIGFTRGATAGGLVTLLVLGSGGAWTAGLGAVVGGALTAALVVTLAARGRVRGEGLILVGIALGQMLAALNDYLLARSDTESAEVARTWQHGSLNAITWSSVEPALLLLVVLLPAGLALGRTARALELGDDLAAGLGLTPRRVRGGLIGYGVVLASVCVAVAGPIGFVALAAPQVAGRLTGSGTLEVLPSFAVGAALLSAADLAAGRVLSPFQVPVGLLTFALGGLYLLWLLGRSGSVSRG